MEELGIEKPLNRNDGISFRSWQFIKCQLLFVLGLIKGVKDLIRLPSLHW
jgi:hypothetical protein